MNDAQQKVLTTALLVFGVLNVLLCADAFLEGPVAVAMVSFVVAFAAITAGLYVRAGGPPRQPRPRRRLRDLVSNNTWEVLGIGLMIVGVNAVRSLLTARGWSTGGSILVVLIIMAVGTAVWAGFALWRGSHKK